MIPVLTPTEMADVDREAPEPLSVLIRRAAGAVAHAALETMGGGYGRRVVVVAGPGNNGEDGRVAASLLERRGCRCSVIDALDAPDELPDTDLVIDAAFGTGLRNEYDFPRTHAPVLAVDIPSGIDGLTGSVLGRPARAVRTVTFAALKPGLLLGSGPDHCGVIDVADIGLDVGSAGSHLIEPADVNGLVPARGRSAHKWRHAVLVVAGSPGMTGAGHLCSAAAMRAGAGYVRLESPGVGEPDAPVEVVTGDPGTDWADSVGAHLERFGAVVLGPGLGREPETLEQVRRAVAGSGAVPVVIDGDAIRAFAHGDTDVLRGRQIPAVVTPHDAEFEVMSGHRPGADRLAEARGLAVDVGAVVLLKGPTTVIAAPSGEILLVRAGDQRLATAGTGDVLSGIVAANLAAGMDPLYAAATAAQLHGDAALLTPTRGMVASDLLDAIATVRSETTW